MTSVAVGVTPDGRRCPGDVTDAPQAVNGSIVDVLTSIHAQTDENAVGAWTTPASGTRGGPVNYVRKFAPFGP